MQGISNIKSPSKILPKLATKTTQESLIFFQLQQFVGKSSDLRSLNVGPTCGVIVPQQTSPDHLTPNERLRHPLRASHLFQRPLIDLLITLVRGAKYWGELGSFDNRHD